MDQAGRKRPEEIESEGGGWRSRPRSYITPTREDILVPGRSRWQGRARFEKRHNFVSAGSSHRRLPKSYWGTRGTRPRRTLVS